VWSRVRHRRLQAISIVVLAGLLTTSLCLGPLYQRAMEQALAGSVLAHASPDQKALRLTANDRGLTELAAELPTSIEPLLADPIGSSAVPVSVRLQTSAGVLANRLYAVDGACEHLEVVQGRCPAAAGEVMVSAPDAEENGWTLDSTAHFEERLETDRLSKGKVTVVGVYAPPADDEWLGAPITGRVGTKVQDVRGAATDDWVTDPETFATPDVATWHQITASVVWSVDSDAVGHDELIRLGEVVDGVRQDALENPSGVHVLVSTDLPGLAERVASGSEQGRTTVVVLVAQLLVLVAVVLWMVLVAATDDRRPELALARLRGRGRRGAAAYLLSELLPLTLAGVGAGVLVAPFMMALVARAVFPVPVPREVRGDFLLAAGGAALAVLVVVLAAATRAVREPVDSLLRAVRARHAGTGASATEVALIVFSLTAVVALLSGNLEGPLATLAPTLLAVAVGLLLARALAPVTRLVSRRLLRGGRAVSAAGIVTAIRRPAARRVLVMVVVASSLLVFCVDAMVTGQHNRHNAAEQANGARYSLVVQPASLADLAAALAVADPGHEHLTPVVTTTQVGSANAQTVAVDSDAFPRVAYFPLSRPGRGDWAAIAAPDAAPLRLTGGTLAGTVASQDVILSGAADDRTDLLKIGLQLLAADGQTVTPDLSLIPLSDRSASFSAPVPCQDGCTVTGIAVSSPPAGVIHGTVMLQHLTIDGQPWALGAPTDWRRQTGSDGSVVPAADPAGNVGVVVAGKGSSPPVLVHAWVPQPVPALVTVKEEEQEGVFSAPGLEGQIEMTAAGTLPRVPGSAPGARVVDLAGLLRRPEVSTTNVAMEVWADDAAAMDRAVTELRERGVVMGEVTTVNDVRADLDASPAAWSLALSVLVGLAAVLVAMLVMIVSTATTWRARASDLAALRMAGLPDRSLRRLELLGQLPVVLVGGLAGAACGVIAAVVALPGVRQFTDSPSVDTTDFSTPWLVVVLGAMVGVLLLSAVALAAGRWTARRATLVRIREVA
jgi:putative ABC transport system permease protein